MSLAVLSSYSLFGLTVKPVQVEVHVGAGLPSFSIVGLPGMGVRESRDRVRAAIVNSGLDFPAGRITANLAPADLRKESGRFDLAIAVGVILASGQLVREDGQLPNLKPYVFIGELSLTGSLNMTDAALVMALAIAKQRPDAILIMAGKAARIAALVPSLTVLQADSLLEVIDFLAGRHALKKPIKIDIEKKYFDKDLCMSDVRGQSLARFALEIAAAGGHSLLFSGSPGVGKSMLAQRLPTLLPKLTEEQALESAAISSLFNSLLSLPIYPPFRAPHHSASMFALVGGGAYPRPGEISLAHRGVLFLDELPEFNRSALEALREPLETGLITIARVAGSCQFPARFQLIAAMNPCPCGWLNHPQKPCTCSADSISRYKNKISGPLIDRIDIHINLGVETSWLELPVGESSDVIRGRVNAARDKQLARQACLNSELNARDLSEVLVLESNAKNMLDKMVIKWAWSARSTQRCLRVAQTIADIKGAKNIGVEHISQAAQFRLSFSKTI